MGKENDRCSMFISELTLMDRILFAEAIENREFAEACLSIILEDECVLKMPPQAEKEILWLLYQKYSRKKIAEMRFLSEETVKIHIKHILRKLNFTNTIEMLDFLREIGIMELLEKQQEFNKNE